MAVGLVVDYMVHIVHYFLHQVQHAVGSFHMSCNNLDFNMRVYSVPVMNKRDAIIQRTCLQTLHAFPSHYPGIRLQNTFRFFLQNSSTPKDQRIANGLGEIGPSVCVGAATTFLGILPMAFANNHVFRVFLKMFIIIIGFGVRA